MTRTSRCNLRVAGLTDRISLFAPAEDDDRGVTNGRVPFAGRRLAWRRRCHDTRRILSWRQVSWARAHDVPDGTWSNDAGSRSARETCGHARSVWRGTSPTRCPSVTFQP